MRQILSQDRQVEKLKRRRQQVLGKRLSIFGRSFALLSHVSFLSTSQTDLILPKEDSFSKDGELGFMRRESQHDKISIHSIQDILHVRRVPRSSSLSSNELHDLMFSFSGNCGIREDHFELEIVRIQTTQGDSHSSRQDCWRVSPGCTSGFPGPVWP